MVADPAARRVAGHASADDQVPVRRHRAADRIGVGRVRAVESRAALTGLRLPALVAAAVAAACLAFPAAGARQGQSTERAVIFYYPWYSTPTKDGRWAHWYVEQDGAPLLSTAYFPSRGLYSSSNAQDRVRADA